MTKRLSTKPTRTRFLAPAGLPPVADKAVGKDTIAGVAMITRGPALGHSMWIDSDFLDQVAYATNARRPIKSRWTHPGVSSDGLGKLVGHCSKAMRDGDVVRADLKIADISHRSPKGDLGAYVMEQANSHPEDFGLSIVFEHDRDAEIAFHLEHGAEWRTYDGGYKCLSLENFQSPDPDNVDNLPHCRLRRLSACDVVGDPAANPAGLFHAESAVVPAAADAFVSYVLGISDAPPPEPFQGIDADRAKAFAGRFLARQGVRLTTQTTNERNGHAMPQPTPGKKTLGKIFGTETPPTTPAKLGSKTKPAATPAKPAAKLAAGAAATKLAEGDEKKDEDLDEEEEPVASDDRPDNADPAKPEEEKADDDQPAGVQTTCPACDHSFIVDAETGDSSEMEGDDDKKEEDLDDDAKPADEEEKPKAEDLSAYLQTFGAAAGAKMFAAGVGFKSAARQRVASLQKQLAASRKEIARLQAIVKNDREGEAEGVSFGAEGKAKQFSNVPPTVARFAAACVPKAK
jgi:hypothetical protein